MRRLIKPKQSDSSPAKGQSPKEDKVFFRKSSTAKKPNRTQNSPQHATPR